VVGLALDRLDGAGVRFREPAAIAAATPRSAGDRPCISAKPARSGERLQPGNLDAHPRADQSGLAEDGAQSVHRAA